MPLPDDPEFLSYYRTQTFVETGTSRGDGVAKALEAGFGAIYSTEVSVFDFGWCSHRFCEQRASVHLYNMDSREFLEWFLYIPTSPCTFWLDAHWCESGGGDPKDVPLLEELGIIRRHYIKNHIILIDDVRLFGQDGFPEMEVVRKSLWRINKEYTLRLHNSRDFEKDILVAYV